MPSTSKELRAKFGIKPDRAERVILNHGGKIVKGGWIVIPKHINKAEGLAYAEFWDAVQFLLEEWDYAILEYKYTVQYYLKLFKWKIPFYKESYSEEDAWHFIKGFFDLSVRLRPEELENSFVHTKEKPKTFQLDSLICMRIFKIENDAR